MDRIWSAISGIARIAVWCGGIMLFLAAGIVTAEVTVRKLIPSLIGFAESLAASIGAMSLSAIFAHWQEAFRSFIFSGSDEISGYLFAVGTSWSLAYVLCTRGHIRIDAVYGRLPLKIRGWLDLLAMTLLGVFVFAMVYRAYDVTWTNLVEYNRSNTNLRIPLAWAQVPWLAGLALFAIALVTAFLRTLFALVKGDYATAAATAGVATQDEEIENELKGYGIERPHH
ncbi:MAG: TRAP transporter small permease [Hyphomicrobiaceae bacterium]